MESRRIQIIVDQLVKIQSKEDVRFQSRGLPVKVVPQGRGAFRRKSVGKCGELGAEAEVR